MNDVIKIVELVISLLSVLVWPIVVVIIFFVLREPLSGIITRANEFGFGKFVAKMGPISKQGIESKDMTLEQLQNDKFSKTATDLLKIYSDSTIKYFENYIKQATNYDKLDTAEKREKELFSYSKIALLVIIFGNIYNTIYGSQIRILQKLNSSNVENKDTIREYYDSAKKMFANVYSNYSYENYLSYLTISNLIVIEQDGKIIISDFGRDFLKYIVEVRYPLEKLY